MTPDLKLRDIHLPPEPSWWPPAPGWWVLAVLALVALLLLALWIERRRREGRRFQELMDEFDAAAAVGEPAARLAAISELLRRAARLRDPRAATLQGADWLRFLDRVGIEGAEAEAPGAPFSIGAGQILLTGPWQAAPDPQAVEALIEPARQRYRQLVGAP